MHPPFAIGFEEKMLLALFVRGASGRAAQRRFFAVALLPAPHAAKDHARANEQSGAHGYEAHDLEQIENSRPHLDKPQRAEVARQGDNAACGNNKHDGGHNVLDHDGLDVGGADGPKLHAEQGASQDDKDEADVYHAVHGPVDRAAQAHDKGGYKFGAGGDQPRYADDVDEPRHAHKSAHGNGGGQHAGGDAHGQRKPQRDARE